MKKALLFLFVALIVVCAVSCVPGNVGTVEIDFAKDTLPNNTELGPNFASVTDVALEFRNYQDRDAVRGFPVPKKDFEAGKTSVLLPTGESFITVAFYSATQPLADVDLESINVEEGKTVTVVVSYTDLICE